VDFLARNIEELDYALIQRHTIKERGMILARKQEIAKTRKEQLLEEKMK